MSGLDRFRPQRRGATGLFLDTSALFAFFHERAPHHAEARRFFNAVNDGVLPYRPLYVNQHVLGETVTLLVSRVSTGDAVRAIDTLSSTPTVETLQVDEADIAETAEMLQQYRDVEIGFTDHTIRVQATKLSVEYVFTYDGDFETLGLTTIPHWSS